jgi:hypothetical protein
MNSPLHCENENTCEITITENTNENASANTENVNIYVNDSYENMQDLFSCVCFISLIVMFCILILFYSFSNE